MIRFHNTLTNRLEDFVPLEPGRVRMYNCGPTVYDYIHIGNLRSFLLADLLRRFLELEGFEVHQVMNITDVGHLLDDAAGGEGQDRLEKAAAREKRDAWAIARFYADAFLEDIRKFNITPAQHYPRATEHIDGMIRMIERLVEQGHAYVVDGEVYYDLSRFPAYGRLSGNTLEKLEAGARVAPDPKKRSPHDFALWKHDPKHQMKWPSPWSEGFPGWHIECSAMSLHYLGEQLDIHTGGEDNVFPHHECEIAQSEAFTGKPFVRYWLHARFLLVDGEKMSKSLGNFYTPRDLLARGTSVRAIRYALLGTHYRVPQNFTFDALEAAEKACERLQSLVDRIPARARPAGDLRPDLRALCERAESRFRAALADDLGVAGALAAAFEWLSEANALEASGSAAPELNSAEAERLLQTLRVFDRVLGVLDFARVAVPPEIAALVQQREEARRARNFAESDRLREQIRQRGFLVEDTKQGPRVLPA